MRLPSVIFTVFVMCLAAASFSCANTSVPSTTDIMLDIGKIDKRADTSARIDATKVMLDDMTKAWQAGKINEIDGRAIDALVPLLDDDSDVVRGWIACAIGYFGPRAHRALSALRGAEEHRIADIRNEQLVVAPAVDSLAFIEVARKRIEGLSERDIFPEHSEATP